MLAIPAVLSSAFVPKAGVDQAVTEEQEMFLIDTQIPVFFCGITCGLVAEGPFTTFLVIMDIAFIQDIAAALHCWIFSFYPVVKQVDCYVFRVCGRNSVGRKRNRMNYDW